MPGAMVDDCEDADVDGIVLKLEPELWGVRVSDEFLQAIAKTIKRMTTMILMYFIKNLLLFGGRFRSRWFGLGIRTFDHV